MNWRETYKDWVAQAQPKQIAFVDRVYKVCEEHYEAGGDLIVECYTPVELCKEFKTVKEVKAFIELKVEQELNARWGEDDDPQVQRMLDCEAWTDWNS